MEAQQDTRSHEIVGYTIAAILIAFMVFANLCIRTERTIADNEQIQNAPVINVTIDEVFNGLKV